MIHVVNVFLLLTIATFFVHREDSSNANVANNPPETFSQESSYPTITPSPTQIESSPTKAALPTSTSTPPTVTQKPNQNTMSDLIYPGSLIRNQTETALELESSNDPQSVTQWYKDTIDSMNMNVKSFSQNTVNGNTHNSLVSANNNTEIRVTITKNKSESTTKISVTRKST